MNPYEITVLGTMTFAISRLPNPHEVDLDFFSTR